MGICEGWVQVIDAGTLEAGRQTERPSASLKRGGGEKGGGEEDKRRTDIGHGNSMATRSGEKCIKRMVK